MKVGIGWAILLLCHHTLAQGEEDEDESVVELQLADFDLTDSVDEISEASRNVLLNISDYSVKMQLEKDLGDLLKLQSKTNSDLKDVPYTYNRQFNLLTKTGNFLLPKKEFEQLVDFSNKNAELRQNTKILKLKGNSTVVVDREGYLQALATERNITVLFELWSSWQNAFNPTKDNFSGILALSNEAAKLNGEDSVRSYWEMQSEYDNGYKEARELWDKIEPLYQKLHNFVKLRLFDFYGLDQNENDIPVYLLGSNFGNDWSNIAGIILPHSDLYSEVNDKLKQQTVKNIFKLAEKMSQKLNLGALGKQFWKRSRFNYTSCGPHIISFCNKKYTEILTCDKLDFTKFMDIHETVIDIALRNQDYQSLARRAMRYSAVDEALRGLGSLIALENLPVYGFVSDVKWASRFDEYNVRNSALLITALRVLPKLSYYLVADTWRLAVLKSSDEDFTNKWWLNRHQVQGVKSVKNNEADFIGDEFIASNKPYLSKFLGTILQFQLHDYYNKYYSFENGTIVDFIKQDDSFTRVLEDRPNRSWLELLNFYYNIDKISAEPLLEYFEPLEKYLESITYEYRMTQSSTQTLNKFTDAHNLIYSTTTTKHSSTTSSPIAAQSTPHSGSHAKVWVLLGVGGLILLGFVLVMFIRKLRRKRKSNNRRFET